ncbi:MAG: aldehyde dehydrogenase family protein [Verrucomicrobiales bacterium]|nr:aldehyde dehydrogenase family protein [Verrucomicrobiales bacterium]
MSRQRLNVLKTYKLYIGGKFPRTESGRTMTAVDAKDGTHLAHYCHASRKDLRDAVVAARSAFPGWRESTAYLKGQILYRAAEMLESRAESISAELVSASGLTKAEATVEIEAAVDRFVYYAGWTDKYSQVFSSVNPVATSHFNFTTPDPCGVVGVFAPDEPALLGLVTLIAQVILSGNTTVVLASESSPLSSISLAEVFATSDLPGGVVNILTGKRAELAPWLAGHMDVNAIIDGSGGKAVFETLQSGAAKNLKRVHSHALKNKADWFSDAAQDPYRILDTIEFKTAWHPIGV